MNMKLKTFFVLAAMAFILPAEAQTVIVWGSDQYGQTNIPPQLTNYNTKAISAGSQHCLALLANGTVFGWGRNDFGQATGVPTTIAPYTSGGPVVIGGTLLTNVIAISGGGYHNLALTSTGTVVEW